MTYSSFDSEDGFDTDLEVEFEENKQAPGVDETPQGITSKAKSEDTVDPVKLEKVPTFEPGESSMDDKAKIEHSPLSSGSEDRQRRKRVLSRESPSTTSQPDDLFVLEGHTRFQGLNAAGEQVSSGVPAEAMSQFNPNFDVGGNPTSVEDPLTTSETEKIEKSLTEAWLDYHGVDQLDYSNGVYALDRDILGPGDLWSHLPPHSFLSYNIEKARPYTKEELLEDPDIGHYTLEIPFGYILEPGGEGDNTHGIAEMSFNSPKPVWLSSKRVELMLSHMQSIFERVSVQTHPEFWATMVRPAFNDTKKLTEGEVEEMLKEKEIPREWSENGSWPMYSKVPEASVPKLTVHRVRGDDWDPTKCNLYIVTEEQRIATADILRRLGKEVNSDWELEGAPAIGAENWGNLFGVPRNG